MLILSLAARPARARALLTALALAPALWAGFAAAPARAQAPTPTPPAPAAAPALLPTTPDAFVVTDGSAPFTAVLDAVAAQGGKPLHGVPPHAVLAALPPGAEAALVGTAGIVAVSRGPVDAAALRTRYGPAAGAAAAAWNGRVQGGFTLADAAAGEGGGGAPLANDALEPPGGARPPGWAEGVQAASGAPGAPGYWETSSYLIGRVAVGLILPESSGGGPNGENWADADPALPGQLRADVILAKTMAAMESWAAAEPRAGLEFVYAFRPGVPTAAEPIALGAGEQQTWIAQVMDTLGYGWVADMFEKVRQFDNDLRAEYAADWAFTLFVADSLKDADGMFADGRFGYAYLGGPFAVLTYDNDGWGIGQFSSVAAHEAAHIFHALDEYEGAHSACTARAGYLDAENQNSQYHPGPDSPACASDVPCVMRGGGDGRTACVHTRAQLGWRDADGDNLLDPLDTAVALALTARPPEVSNVLTVTYAGSAAETPLPSARLTAVSINTVERIEYQVDGGAWASAPAADGALGGETVEEFGFTLGPLADGGHTILLRAANSAGNAASLSDTFTVDATPPLVAVTTTARYAGAEFVDFWVEWTAADAPAGVQEVAVEVRDETGAPGAWQAWATAPGSGRALFVGQEGHTYGFRTRARDAAGNASAAAATTRTVTVCPVAADPGDAAGDDAQQNARWLQTDGAAHARTFPRAGDADWIRFHAVAGVAYTVVTENAGGAGDTLLDVILPDGATLQNDDDPLGGLGSRIAWTAAGDGVVYARVRHADPNAYGCAASYRLRVAAGDGTAPGAALTLAAGAPWANAAGVTARLDAWTSGAGGSAADIRHMRTTTGNDLAAVAWRQYVGEFSVTLPGDEGAHTLLAQVMDRSGRISPVVSDTVGVDVTPPTAQIAPAVAQAGALAVSWSGQDALSGVEDFDVEVSDGDGGAWAAWRTHTHDLGGTLAAQAGHSYRLRVRARDRAGNVGAWAESAPAQPAALAPAPNVYLPFVGGRR